MIEKVKQFFRKHSEIIGISILILYVIILGFGTIGEVFEIEWILKFPLFNI